ncbi:MAG: hypothetical protein JNJ54_08225 [Myxococcaceae bacterium]|nr:hypothetical protein [Myxococcaceae bacterium]
MTALVVALALGAQPNPFLAQGKELYEGLDFEQCVERLAQASSQWQSTKDELRDIELYAGLCRFNLGQAKKAAEHFRTALRIDETADLPPYSSPKAVDLFLKVKRSLQAPPEPLPDSDLPPDAPRQPKLEPRPPPAPPSLFERHPGPMVLGITAGVSMAVAVGLGVNARNLAIQANEARTDREFGDKAAAARANATGANIAWILAASAAVAAVIVYLLE